MANIAISELQTEATSISQDDLLLVSKSSGEDNNVFTSAKMKWSVIDNIINNKIANLISTVTNLRETINDIINSDGTEQEETLEYCKLDGNLGILGTDIPSYDNITKWEITIQKQYLDGDQRRVYDNVSPNVDNTYIYEYNTPETSLVDLTRWRLYNESQYRTFKFMVFRDNYTASVKYDQLWYTTNNYYTGTTQNYYVASNNYIKDEYWYSNQLTIVYNKVTNDVSITGKTPQSYSYKGEKQPVRSGTTTGFVDHLLSTANWRWGLIGRVYYIKGYNSSNEEIANLVPKMKNNYIYMYDTKSSTVIPFRGSGFATAPVS